MDITNGSSDPPLLALALSFDELIFTFSDLFSFQISVQYKVQHIFT
jgi:hypothetical protein